MIKEYFANLILHHSDVLFDFPTKSVEYLTTPPNESSSVAVIDTGENMQTGGRLRRTRSRLDPEEPFRISYGEGLSNFDIKATIDFQRHHGWLATMTIEWPPSRLARSTATTWRGKPRRLSDWYKPAKLMCFRHDGFWQAMDTVRDRLLLEELWHTNKALWKLWT